MEAIIRKQLVETLEGEGSGKGLVGLRKRWGPGLDRLLKNAHLLRFSHPSSLRPSLFSSDYAPLSSRTRDEAGFR